jgi:membrane dipeptidase
VCATHSNAAAIVGDDPRHLTDEQLVSIRARDGIVGLNLYGRFLAPDHPMSPATVDHALDHVEHVASIVGRDRVGLGSDADGGFPATDLPVGLRRLGALATLADGLAARGWNPAEIDGFKRQNWRRWWMSGPPTPSVSAPADATG